MRTIYRCAAALSAQHDAPSVALEAYNGRVRVINLAACVIILDCGERRRVAGVRRINETIHGKAFQV